MLLEDILSDETAGMASTENTILLKEDAKILKEAIKRLPKREQFIIRNRYGLNGGKILTQSKIGEKLGMSQANVSKLEKNIKRKLFYFLENEVQVEDNDFYFDLISEEV